MNILNPFNDESKNLKTDNRERTAMADFWEATAYYLATANRSATGDPACKTCNQVIPSSLSFTCTCTKRGELHEDG